MSETTWTSQLGEHSTGPQSHGRLVQPFPVAGDLLAVAQAEWDLTKPSDVDTAAMGLPRPWDPATVRATILRKELWAWLDAVADWINTEHLWDASESIPPCWPRHPHLVHEIAVLADQRRRAALELTSDSLEQWQRIQLPAFTERMRHRLRRHCDDGHQPGAVEPVHNRYHQTIPTQNRAAAYSDDLSQTA